MGVLEELTSSSGRRRGVPGQARATKVRQM